MRYDTAKKKGGFTGMLKIDLPCMYCENSKHEKCTAELLESSGFLHRGMMHCSCYRNEHKELRDPIKKIPKKS